MYDTAFTNLASYPAGSYTATFTGNGKTNSVTVFKKGIVLSDWIQAMPVPFNQQLTVYLKAPETGSISLQLIDADGRVVSAGTLYTQKGNIYTVPFTNTALPRGAYFIRYNGVTQKRTIKVIKN